MEGASQSTELKAQTNNTAQQKGNRIMQTLNFDSIEEIKALIEELTKIADEHYGYEVERYAIEDIRRAWEIAVDEALGGKRVLDSDDPCALLDTVHHPFDVNGGYPDESMRFDEWDEDYWGVNLVYGFYVDCDRYVAVKHSVPHDSFRDIGLAVVSDYILQRAAW